MRVPQAQAHPVAEIEFNLPGRWLGTLARRDDWTGCTRLLVQRSGIHPRIETDEGPLIDRRMRVSAQTEDGIGYLAGYGARLWLFVQDLDQFQQTYRKWRSIVRLKAVAMSLSNAHSDLEKNGSGKAA